ncbi:hypothetical protein KP509_38G004500 [Ceratopteris richardii]|nr:hypothetical protein KP509_38G004500 [Ceratopteris richardii]
MEDPPFYGCSCAAGWKNALSVSYMPCIALQCDGSNDCSQHELPPSPVFAPPDSTLNFNVCRYPVCGHGKCIMSQTDLFYECICEDGYENLLNMSIGYCLLQCELEGTCNTAATPVDHNAPQASSTPDQVFSNGYVNRKVSLFIMSLIPVIQTLFLIHVGLSRWMFLLPLWVCYKNMFANSTM